MSKKGVKMAGFVERIGLKSLVFFLETMWHRFEIVEAEMTVQAADSLPIPVQYQTIKNVHMETIRIAINQMPHLNYHQGQVVRPAQYGQNRSDNMLKHFLDVRTQR